MIPISIQEVRGLAKQILFGVMADALLTAACYSLRLNLAAASLVLLVSVVVQALSGTIVSAIVASFIAAAFLNYFFVPPVLSWRVASPFDLIALAAFISTAVVITRLVSKAGEEATKAEHRRQCIEQVYQCSERLLMLGPEDGVISGLLATYREIFDLTAVCFFQGESAEIFSAGDADVLASHTRSAYFSATDGDDPVRGVCIRCIRSRGRVTGVIGFQGLRDPELTVRSLVTMTVNALDRASALKAASTAAAESRTEAFRAVVLDALAHEFKTPLATILAAAGGLRETVTTTAEQELAEEIEAEAGRLTDLTSSLLRRAETDGEQIQARLTRVDLMLVAESIVARYARKHRDRLITFEAPEVQCAYVAADEELLDVVIGQLLDNAVKYSLPGSPIEVVLACDRQSARVRVWNGDSAVSPVDRPQIFDRFYRGAATRSKVAGSGLGLYVARKIAWAHDGALYLEERDAASAGTAFRLILPRTQNEETNGRVNNQLVGSR
jgi:two-component system sensor histidine kinase KdpD